MANRPLIALDTMVILDLLQDDSPHHASILPVYEDAKNKRTRLLISEICVAEVFKLATATASGKLTAVQAVDAIQRFMNSDFIERQDLTRREAAKAAELSRDKGLEACDAMIVATAALNKECLVLYTRDGKIRRKSQTSPLDLSGQIGSPGLPIRCPNPADYALLPRLNERL